MSDVDDQEEGEDQEGEVLWPRSFEEELEDLEEELDGLEEDLDEDEEEGQEGLGYLGEDEDPFGESEALPPEVEDRQLP